MSALPDNGTPELPNTITPETNPWLATAGCFADNDTLEPMLREIYAARDADDARG